MNNLVDQRLGNSYQVIKEVHAALSQILFLADNMSLLAPREIELRESTDFKYLQWRREGDPDWNDLISVEDLAKGIVLPAGVSFGVPEPADAEKVYARTKGSWVEAIAASLIGQINGVASLGTDGKVPTEQLPDSAAAPVNADWNATNGLARILNKPTLFSGAYGDLSGKPDLFSGSYEDLTDKPTIPTVDVTEAPKNGKQYARKDGAWAEVASSSSGSGGGFMPTKIAAGTTFVVPADNQAFFRNLAVEGTLQIDGYLIEV